MTPELVRALSAFSWPLLIAVVVFCFRKDIRNLFARFSKASLKGVEFHFTSIGLEKSFTLHAAGRTIPPAVHDGLRQLIPQVEVTEQAMDEIRALPQDRQIALLIPLLEATVDWGLAQIGAAEKDTHIGVRITSPALEDIYEDGTGYIPALVTGKHRTHGVVVAFITDDINGGLVQTGTMISMNLHAAKLILPEEKPHTLNVVIVCSTQDQQGFWSVIASLQQSFRPAIESQRLRLLPTVPDVQFLEKYVVAMHEALKAAAQPPLPLSSPNAPAPTQ
ncbi:MAG: hypothetical protein QY327_01445 [Fimbriimonadaceae bacterium]|nr:MAG: hypothetical protein UZ18_ATM001002063 [Armatimonadetes bacterium OLB18]WKZ80565.1 MAG: hypothetical protein QY327_01445 [Fimbriimonadaceae bacterium]